MRKKYNLLIIISVIGIIIDQITKYYIAFTMQLHQSIDVIKGLFSITYVRNKGAAFGFLSTVNSIYVTIFFILTSIIAIGVIVFMYKETKDEDLPMHISLSLILSGAIGNLLDRVINHEVIDFLDFYWNNYHWPVFNVADSCITVGMFIMVFSMLKGDSSATKALSHKD